MIRQALMEKGIYLSTDKFREVMNITTKDVMFNQVRFSKKTSLEEVLTIAESAAKILKKCS